MQVFDRFPFPGIGAFFRCCCGFTLADFFSLEVGPHFTGRLLPPKNTTEGMYMVKDTLYALSRPEALTSKIFVQFSLLEVSEFRFLHHNCASRIS